MVKKTIHAAPKFPNPAPTTLIIGPATGWPDFMGVRWNLNFAKAGFH